MQLNELHCLAIEFNITAMNVICQSNFSGENDCLVE